MILKASEILGVNASKDLGIYLGFPLSPNRPTKRDVDYILTKVKNKLAGWKTRFLSKAGRTCLANTTLNAIPNYYMQNMHLPKAVLHDLDRIIVDFVWGSSDQGKKSTSWGKKLCSCQNIKEGFGLEAMSS